MNKTVVFESLEGDLVYIELKQLVSVDRYLMPSQRLLLASSEKEEAYIEAEFSGQVKDVFLIYRTTSNLASIQVELPSNKSSGIVMYLGDHGPVDEYIKDEMTFKACVGNLPVASKQTQLVFHGIHLEKKVNATYKLK